MSDKDAAFECYSQSSAACDRENGGFPNNKHVSFAQKEAMLTFMLEHKELAMRDHTNEGLWTDLAQILNNVHEGAVRPIDNWKKQWKLWSTSVQRKKNDLSITLLDLQLLSFLDSVSEAENLKATLKNFISDINNSLNSDQLSAITGKLPQLLKDNGLTTLIDRLQNLEVKEVTFKSNIDASTNRLSELIILKQEIEKEANFIINNLDQSENQVLLVKTEKIELLNEIRNHINGQYV